MAEAVVDPGRGAIEVSLKLDAAHLEEALGAWAGEPVDLEDPPEAVDPILFGYVRDRFELRLRNGAALDLAWVGKDLLFQDVWIFFEAALPERDSLPSPDAPLLVRHVVMLETLPRQINTITFLSGPEVETLHFAVEQDEWQALDMNVYAAIEEAAAATPFFAPLAHVQTEGEGPSRIVLIGDVPGGWRTFRPVMERIASRRNATVHAVSLPGMGAPAPLLPERIGPRDTPLLDNASARVVDLLQARDVRDAVLVGRGVGWIVAARAAAAAPDRVRTAMALGDPGFFTPEELREKTLFDRLAIIGTLTRRWRVEDGRRWRQDLERLLEVRSGGRTDLRAWLEERTLITADPTMQGYLLEAIAVDPDEVEAGVRLREVNVAEGVEERLERMIGALLAEDAPAKR